MIIFVLGGVRSGKSRIGEEYALKLGARFGLADDATPPPPLYYFATAQSDPSDHEMTARIAGHKASRDQRFTTIEIGSGIRTTAGSKTGSGSDKHDTSLAASISLLPSPSILVIDGMGVWLSGLMARDAAWQPQLTATLLAIKHGKHSAVFISDEVGLGLLPSNSLARQFMDDLGTLNQTLAKAADKVVVCVAGIASVIKGET